ncbi:MAG TPA: hypothetical protein VFA43_10985 [Gemmatimonadaceae bacterium]|nr:hypothetical protein [Gemmatimonadaceae bacterium]
MTAHAWSPLLALSVLTARPCVGQQSLGDAWWTGSVQAAGAATLPAGHVLFEPYVYDVIGDHSQTFTSRTYLIYGLADRVSVGVIPIFGYDAVSGGPSSAHLGFEDLTAQAQYRLTQFHVGSWVPTTSVLIQETFPTGKYDRLGDRTSDGLGAGAYTTTLALYSQTYFWMPTGRVLRSRLDVQQTILSSRVPIADASVYGTATGFGGHADPGPSTFVDLAAEYSVTRNWVLACDANYGWNGDTRVVGGAAVRHTGSSEAIGFTPAVEYNWNAGVGLIVGARVIEIARNTGRSVTPVIALNVVH